jgi:hypothetical protein
MKGRREPFRCLKTASYTGKAANAKYAYKVRKTKEAAVTGAETRRETNG